LQELLGTDGVNYVEYLGSLTIGSGDALVIPAGKTVKVGGSVTVATGGALAVEGSLTLPATGTITNNGTVIGSQDFIADLGGDTVPIDAGLPAADPGAGSVTAVKDLTLGATAPFWDGYDLTIFVYGTLTIEGNAPAPGTAKVVAIKDVLIDPGTAATVATLTNTADVNVSNATITLNENKTVTVTLPSPLSGPTFKVTGEDGVLKVSGSILINNAHVTNNNGFVEFTEPVTKAVITGNGRVRFSGAAAFATNTSTITAGLVEFTNAATPTFAVANSSITAEKITFTKGLTLSAALTLNGNIVLPDATAEIALGASALTLKTGSTITVKDAIVLTATTDSTLTGSATGAKITPVLAVSPAPAKLTLTTANLTLTGGPLTVANDATLDLGTQSLIVGETDTVTLAKASVTGGAFAGATGEVTLANTNAITLATGGTIVVAGTGKLSLLNSEFGVGTYTAVGAVVISSLTAGDTIVTSTTAADGLTIGTSSNTLGLKGQGTTAATYTLKKAAAKKVAIAAAGITVGNGTTSDTSSLEASATAQIALAGASAIGLGNGSTLVLATGAKIGTFTASPATLGPNKTGASLGGAVLTNDTSSLVNTTGTLTATTADATLTGASGGASSIAAAAVFVDGS
jgi:hypothetical protein